MKVEEIIGMLVGGEQGGMNYARTFQVRPRFSVLFPISHRSINATLVRA